MSLFGRRSHEAVKCRMKNVFSVVIFLLLHHVGINSSNRFLTVWNKNLKTTSLREIKVIGRQM